MTLFLVFVFSFFVFFISLSLSSRSETQKTSSQKRSPQKRSLSLSLSLPLHLRATANESYLRSANDHFVAYLYQEGGGRALAFTPNTYFWAANVLLATLTDGGTFHERSRHFLRQWACAEGDEVRYSPRGRAVAGSAPTLGATAASAFLAAAYGDRIKVRRVGGVFLLLLHRRPRSRGRVRRRRGKKNLNTSSSAPPPFPLDLE